MVVDALIAKLTRGRKQPTGVQVLQVKTSAMIKELNQHDLVCLARALDMIDAKGHVDVSKLEHSAFVIVCTGTECFCS